MPSDFEKAHREWLKEYVDKYQSNPDASENASWAREWCEHTLKKHQCLKAESLIQDQLIDIEKLRTENAKMRGALEFYAKAKHDSNDWGPVYEERPDGVYKNSQPGRTAREALKETGGDE